MSQFAEHERLVSEALDAYMGEPTRIEPKSQGRYFSGSADGERAVIEAVGCVDINPVTLIAQDTGKYDGMRPAITGDKIHVSYDAANFADWQPREGDEIVMLARNSRRMKVSRAEADGFGRLVCVGAWASEAEI